MTQATNCCRLAMFFAVAIALLTVPAFAQISDSCDGGQSLGSMDTFPQNLNLPAPLTNALTMTGASCNEQGVDSVTCFVPENDCTINITCNYTPGSTTMAANLYEGPCAASPASCVASNSDTSPVSLASQNLTAGTEYCVVCESAANATAIEVDISETTPGSCGSLPVELMSFSVDDSLDSE